MAIFAKQKQLCTFCFGSFCIFICLHLINYFSICFHTFLQETVGSRITKEASDIVLKNASFADIVRTVLCSRNIQDTLRKLLQFQFAMIAVTFFTVFIGVCVLGVSLLRLLICKTYNLIIIIETN